LEQETKMPENIEPTNAEETAEEIAALQEVASEDEDVQAHSQVGVSAPSSQVSLAACA
jgi:hypothetical protein